MIRIQRQNKDEAAPAPAPAQPPAEQPKPKIILKKRDAAAAVPAPEKKPAAAAPAPASAKPAPKKTVSSNTAMLVQMAIVGFLLLVGGGILLKVGHSRKVRLQKEALALKQEIDVASQNFSKIEATASVVANLALAARPCVQTVSAAVMAILGEPVEKEIPGIQSAPAPAAAPAATPASASPAPTPALTPSAQREGARELDGAGREAPYGVESLAEVKMRHALPGPRPKQGASDARPGEPPPPGEAPRTTSRAIAAAAPDDPKIRVLALDVLVKVQRMEDNATLSREVVATARQVRDTALSKLTAETVKNDAYELYNSLATVSSTKKESEELLVAARKGVEDVLAEKARIEAERREQERIAAERRREEERKERIRREVASAQEAVRKAEPLIKEFRYSEGSQILEDQYKLLTVDDGKNVLRTPRERFARLTAIKKHMVDRLNSHPFRWGWTLGTSPQDIVGADETEVRIKGKATPWTEIPMPQVLKILKNYMVKDLIKAGQYGDYLLSAAVFCYENNELTAAAEYVRLAAGEDPALSSEAARLMTPKDASSAGPAP